MEENINRAGAVKKWLKRIGFYAILFLSGFLISAFAREGLDAMKQTANIAAQTASEAWAPNSNLKAIAKIPLSGATKQTKIAANAKKPQSAVSQKPAAAAEIKKTYADVPLPPPPVVSQEASSSATSSIQENQEPVAPKETIEASPEPTSIPAAPPNQTVSVPQDDPIPPASLAVAATSIGKILFYEIQISGAAVGTSNQDFIRIYNPNGFAVDITGWKLKKKTRTGTEDPIPPSTIPKGTIITPGGTLIWANSGDNFAVTIGAQFPSASMAISKNNSIALFDSNGNVIDSVAWGNGTNQYIEGSPYPGNPEGGQILRRKAQDGALQDTDNNATDFSL